MAVYAVCEKCKDRRTNCLDQSGHKSWVGWIADVQFVRGGPRLRKTYGSGLDKPKELAEIQERKWKTDRERGVLLPQKGLALRSVLDVAEEWWTKVAIGKGQIKNARSEQSRVEAIKKVFGHKLLTNALPEAKIERERFMTLDGTEEWIVARRESGIAVGTINRDLKPLHWILDFAVERGYIAVSPLDALKQLKGERIHDRWMPEEELGLLLQAAVDLGDMELADFIAVGVNTGFRLGNLERLTARDIDGDLLMAVQTKSGNPYSIPISPDIEPILRRLIRQRPTGPLLIGRDNNVGERFRAAARKAGLYPDEKVKNGNKDNDRVTIHTLRHTFAVLYLKRGGDIYKLSKLLGHASVAITDKIYARFCPKEKLKEAPLISTPIPQLQAPKLKVV